MTVIHCPHDKLFKNILTNKKVAREFFENYLPKKILPLVDFNSLEICNNTYVSGLLESTSSDVLFKVKIAGKIGYIYLLCEHQSTIDALMPLRVLEYIIQIWRDHIKINSKKPLPLVIPIVFYHGSKIYDGSQDIRDLIDAPHELIDEFLFGPFYLIDTHSLKDDDLHNQQLLGFFIFVLKNIFEKNFRDKETTFINMLSNLLNTLNSNDMMSSKNINTLLFYVLEVGEISQPKEFIEHIHQKLPSRLRGEFMTGAEYLRQEGRLEGRTEGRLEGRTEGRLEGKIEGQANMLLRQLQLKFGFIPPSYRKLLEQADTNSLNIWGERILFAISLQQVFDEHVTA